MVDRYKNLNVAYTRSWEVVRLLHLYALTPLFIIQHLIQIDTKCEKLRGVLLRLLKKNFISKCVRKLTALREIYYQKTSCEITLKLVAKSMKVYVNELKLPYFKRAKLLLLSFQEKDIYPDLLLVFPKKDINPSVGVAVEIERTRKSSKRLLKKISKYTNRTLIDGVLYVCEKENISSIIMGIYKSKVMLKSYRIQHYEKNFLALFYSICANKTPNDEMFNGDSKSILFPNWMKYLREVSHHER